MLPRDRRISEESDTIEIYLASDEKTILLKSNEKNSIKDADNLVISAGGFRLREEAEICGKRIKNSILLCGPILRMGFDIGKDKASFILGKHFKDKGKEFGFQIIDDIHGLCFFEEHLNVRVCSSGASVIIGTPSKRFIDKFITIYELNVNLDDKKTLALELYNMSYFESSLRARFLTLVSAIESIGIRDKRSNEVLKHIENLIAITMNSSLSAINKKSILNNINNLRTDSISDSCRQLVRNNLGIDQEAEFNKYYRIRSQISHNGAPHKGINLGSEVVGLESLVSNLLKSLILRNCINSDTGPKSESHIIERKFVD